MKPEDRALIETARAFLQVGRLTFLEWQSLDARTRAAFLIAAHELQGKTLPESQEEHLRRVLGGEQK